MEREKFWTNFIFLLEMMAWVGEFCATRNERMVTVRGSKETGGRVSG